ncbi:MAG TPA: DUF3325 family protein [Rhizomicrobium sp.]|nr:DUF3325 family protein [Rhizomicrobium sp.]
MIAAGLLYLGLFALAASMSRHAPALLGGWKSAFPAAFLPATGWIFIALSLLVSLAAADWPIALVRWGGLLPLMAGVILLGLTFRAAVVQAGAIGAIGLILFGCFHQGVV